MQLNIQIDTNKSNLFLDLLDVLKKDNMINDFKVMPTQTDDKKLNKYEKEILEDISHLSDSIKDADTAKGVDTGICIVMDQLMSDYQVIEQYLYKKAYKKLSKSYKYIDSDVKNYLLSIRSKDDLGIELKSNVYKVRIANSDKNKGKSAGYRLITYLKIVENQLHLLYIYDKSILENLTEKEIDTMILKQI